MTTNINRRFARYIAVPTLAAGILGGAALGMAGMANAGTYSQDQAPQPSMVATPTVKAPPVWSHYGKRGEHWLKVEGLE
ncbi:hypothetical protein ABQE93_03430 [Mycolicibacterium sp. XJ662]